MPPVRTCLGCRVRSEQADLIRLVRRADSIIDGTRPRLPGRGGYLHVDRGCWDLAEKRRALQRCFGPGATLEKGVVPDWEQGPFAR